MTCANIPVSSGCVIAIDWITIWAGIYCISAEKNETNMLRRVEEMKCSYERMMIIYQTNKNISQIQRNCGSGKSLSEAE